MHMRSKESMVKRVTKINILCQTYMQLMLLLLYLFPTNVYCHFTSIGYHWQDKKPILPINFEQVFHSRGSCYHFKFHLCLAWPLTVQKLQGVELDYMIFNMTGGFGGRAGIHWPVFSMQGHQEVSRLWTFCTKILRLICWWTPLKGRWLKIVWNIFSSQKQEYGGTPFWKKRK